MTTKDEQLIFKCSSCNKNYEKDLNKDLTKRFANPCRFCSKDLNKFILLLSKVFDHMNTWIIDKNLMKHHYLTKNLFIVI